MEKVKEIMHELGYAEEDIDGIINVYPLTDYKPETLAEKIRNNYDFLLSLGYSKANIIKMTKSFPSIYDLTTENIKQKIEDMINLGYSKENIMKMTKSSPVIYGLSIENMKQKIEEMMKLGYSKENIIKMTKSMPTIYGLSIENMKQKIEEMMKLGYSKEDIIKMTKSMPAIYCLTMKNIEQKIEVMTKLGYSKEEVIEMTKGLPAMYGFSIEKMEQKIKFYDSIGLHELAVVTPKDLMQSTNVSYARYMFYLQEKGIKIDMTNYSKLFIAQKQFEKSYGITKEELLKRYDYSKVEKKQVGFGTVSSLARATKGVGVEEAQKSAEFLDSLEQDLNLKNGDKKGWEQDD